MDKNNRTPKLVIRRVINAKRDKVFAAWTNPEIMKEWFFPGTGKAIVINELKLGGKFQNTMILDSGPNDREGCGNQSKTDTYNHTGEYVEITPPEKLVFTWNSHLVTNSQVTVELRELGEATELTLTHELLGTEEIKQKHSDGWNGCLEKLSSYLG